jgi:hypothetical protein
MKPKYYILIDKDEMLDYDVKSLTPKIRQYTWYGDRLNNNKGKK